MKYDKFIRPQDFPFGKITDIKVLKRKKGTTRKKFDKEVNYLDCTAAFDIETTNIIEHTKKKDAIKIDSNSSYAFMYVWQMHFHFNDENITVIGRTWEEFSDFMYELGEMIDETDRMVIWVHNLTFEFTYSKSILDFDSEGVFCMELRKIAKAITSNKKFEFRCSAIQTNMSLKMLTEDVEHAKLDGEEFDYSKIRTHETPLTLDEYQYCINDVRGLCEAMEYRMKIFNDDLYTIPMTSTGYVRREAKEALKAFRHSSLFKDEIDGYNTYKFLREIFRGGDCHANRFLAGKILKNVKSFDRSSSYPDVMVNELFPMTKFKAYEYEADEDTINELLEEHIPFITRVTLTNVKVKDNTVSPYIPESKCNFKYNAKIDNGRILEAEMLEISICDIDWELIKDDYDYETAEFENVMVSKYKKLPKEFTDLVISYYTAKTTLKDVIGKEEEYAKAKALLNALYGMLVQKVLMETHKFNPLTLEVELESEPTTEEEYLEAANKSLLFYRIGVYVTAYARKWLKKGIKNVQEQGGTFVYADTDSVKYIGDVNWDDFNIYLINRSTESGAHATDPNGKEHYMGNYEKDGKYERFCTLGAKKYCYEYFNKEGEYDFAITISGVPKEEGAKIMGSCDNFKLGYIFKDTGKLLPVYNDNRDNGNRIVTDYLGNTTTVHISSYVALADVDYKLGLSDEYLDLVEDNLVYLKYAIDKEL